MSVEDQIALLTQRVGVDRFNRLVSGLDQAATRGDAERLLRASAFFRALFERQIDWLEHEADLTKSALSAIFTDFDARLDPARSEAAISADLRVLRQRAMLYIVWRSFTSQSGLDETLAAMSALADFVIKVAVRVANTEVTQRFGQPIGDDTGSVQGLIVIGMGKLGGRELNLSSDIDIIFAYDESGSTQGGRSSTSNQEFFTRVAQRVIRLIDTVTQEGRVFRVDTRLRPFGESGALVASYQSLENYYQQHGRDWERYALLKARCITGTLEQTRAFEQLAQQFVYRRYTDFSVIDGLRDMKALIDAERVSKGLSSDIKRGPGGIREAEFVVQSHQLVRGGRIPAIQKAGFQEAAKALSEAECLAHESAQTLLEQYRYLRQVEHAIQALRDEQTHAIPETDEARSGLCLLLRYDSWDAFYTECQRSRTIIATAFDALLETTSEHSQLIVGIDTEAPALDLNALKALQVVSEQDLAAQMTLFVAETRFRVMEPEGSRRLQKTLPLIVKAVDRYSDPAQVLQRVLAIVTSVLKRSAYLVLLSENPRALSRLVDLVAKSRPIADKLVESPELLDELLFPDRLLTAPSKRDIQHLADSVMASIEFDDLEAVMQHLRRFKDAIAFRVAASELEGSIALMKVSDNLSFLAEVIVERSVAIAQQQLIDKYGQPGDGAGFCVMAYGKLGGLELSYESDLDLVFVCSGENGFTDGAKSIENQRFFTRLVQRVIHMLSTNMMGGRLYEVDLRLRPNGDSGLLVTSFASLDRYLGKDAWTWEHQALVRARVIAGDPPLVQQVEALRAKILANPRHPDVLAEEVTSMRRKMREHQPAVRTETQRATVKYGRGGIVDIEFVVQYLVLRHATQHPGVARWSDVVRILDELEQCEVLSPGDAKGLRDAYLGLRSVMHRAAMSYATDADAAVAADLMTQANAICTRLLPNL